MGDEYRSGRWLTSQHAGRPFDEALEDTDVPIDLRKRAYSSTLNQGHDSSCRGPDFEALSYAFFVGCNLGPTPAVLPRCDRSGHFFSAQDFEGSSGLAVLSLIAFFVGCIMGFLLVALDLIRARNDKFDLIAYIVPTPRYFYLHWSMVGAAGISFLASGTLGIVALLLITSAQ